MNQIKQAVILAGGLGTRLKPYTDTNPKGMYPFEGKPFLQYLIEQIRDFGISKILILLGYLPDKVMDYFEDGSGFGVSIKYDITPVEYETGLRLLHARDKLDDVFLMLYCDNYCPIDFERLLEDYGQNNGLIQFTVYTNRDKYTRDNVLLAENGLVKVYDKTRTVPGLSGVDIGYALVNKRALDLMPEENNNFEKVVYTKLVAQGLLYATVAEHRYYSVGSWERISLTKEFFKSEKAVFLDRDGTLNVRPPRACYIEKPEDFIWLDGAKEAVKKLNDTGVKVILISNQPGIARGNLTEEVLHSIHKKMNHDLSEVGAHIDAIYYCPHNWDEGCFCRKPNPGMLYQAQRDYSLDLRKCTLFGDDERDIQAGNAAGCTSILVNEQYSLLQAVTEFLSTTTERRNIP